MYLQPHLWQWGFRQCLPFSWTTLRDKHCRHPIAIMGVVDYVRAMSCLIFFKSSFLGISKPRVLYQKEQQTTVAVHLEKFWGHGSHLKCGVANILKLKLAFFIDVCPAAAPETTSWIVRMFQIYLPKQDSRGGRSRYNDPLWDNYPIHLFLPFFKDKKSSSLELHTY